MHVKSSEFLGLFVKVMQLMGLLLAVCHYIACAWYGLLELQEAQEFGDWSVDGTWLENFELPDSSNLHCYALALHWSVSQFASSTNDIMPVSTIERSFGVVVIFMGILGFTAFLTSISATTNQILNLQSTRIRDRHQLVRFIKCKRLPPDVGMRLLQYFDRESSTKRR